MRIRKETIESLNAQGIYVSMFPNDETRQQEYNRMLAKYEERCRYISSTSRWDEASQQWVTEGEERPNYKQYAKDEVDKQFERTNTLWGMWYDATVVYMRQGDVFAKRTVNKSKHIDEEFVKKVLAKESKAYSGAYGQFAKDVHNMFVSKFGGNMGWIYPTTYGIGVWVFCNFCSNECIQNVETVLKSAGIEYVNEFSEKGMVYRFKISKKFVNRQKLSA